MSATRYTLREVPVVSRISPLNKLPQEARGMMLSNCDSISLASLYRDPVWRHSVEQELTKATTRTLSRFTDSPAQFQSMMRRTRCVISGSTALYHILRSPSAWKPGDVDVLTPSNTFGEVVDFIRALPGAYVEKEYAHNYNPYNEDDNNDTGFTHIVQIRTPFCKFDVIRSCSRSPYQPIAFYYGTHVMNAISSDMTICTYPSLTLKHIAVLTDPRNDDHTANTCKAIDKYSDRGFTFKTSGRSSVPPGNKCKAIIACPNRDRAFGDEHCLVLPNGKRPVDETLDFLHDTQTTVWKLGGVPCKNRECFVRISPTSGTVRMGDIRQFVFSN